MWQNIVLLAGVFLCLPSSARADFLQAQQAMAEGKFAEAQILFLSEVNENPNGVHAQDAEWLAAVCLKEMRSYDVFVQAAAIYSAHYPGTERSAQLRYWAAMCPKWKGNPQASIPLLEALASEPGCPVSIVFKEIEDLF